MGLVRPLPRTIIATPGKVRAAARGSHGLAVGSGSDRRSKADLLRPRPRLWWRAFRLLSTQEDAVADVEAHITGTVWKVECEVGDEIEEGDTVVILESMKMEMPVEAEDSGTVKEILCEEGQAVNEGDTLVILE